MLISHMETTKELVGIAADTRSYADIAMMVAPTYHTGLVGSTYAPSAVVLPERLRADMATGRTIVPFEIAIDKILPGIVVLGFMLPRKSCIKAILIKKPNAQGDTVAVGLGKS